MQMFIIRLLLKGSANSTVVNEPIRKGCRALRFVHLKSVTKIYLTEVTVS